MARSPAIMDRARDNGPLIALIVLLVAAFFLGGGSRGDIASLVVLRPLAIGCLAYGLFRMRAADWQRNRAALSLMAAVCGLLALHLIPLPPFVWENLPGRGVVVLGDRLADLDGVWRPLSLVPFRAWNAMWAMAVPAAALVLAAQLTAEQQWTVVKVILALALASAMLAILQVVSGFSPALYPYRVSNSDSPVGLFANRNHQAALMCLALPMLALIAVRPGHRSPMVAQSLAAGLGLALALLVLASGSRGGLAFLFVAGAGAGLIVWRRPQLKRTRTRKNQWLAPAAVGGGALVAAIGLAAIFSRADAIDRITGGDPVEDNRFAVWQETGRIVGDYMPFGSGFGSFERVFAMIEPPHMLSLAYWNHAHNDWLEWALEGGLPAVILMLAAIALWASSALRIWRAIAAGSEQILLAAVGALTIFILGLWSLVDYPLRVPSLAALSAVAAVWMAQAGATSRQRQSSTRVDEGLRRRDRPGAATNWDRTS